MKPIPAKTVIHCPTKALDQQVCKIFDDAGLKFASGNSYLERDRWSDYGDQTCYSSSEGQYCELEIYKEAGYTILSASEFIKMNEVQPTSIWDHPDIEKAFHEFFQTAGYFHEFLASKRKPKFSLLCADGIEVNDPEQIVWVLTSRGYSPAIAKEVADGKLKAFSTEQAANICNKKTILENHGISKEDCEMIFRKTATPAGQKAGDN